jgi:hypothetical protein
MGSKPIDKTFDLKPGWQKAILALWESGATDEEVRAWIQKQRGFINDYIFDYWRENVPEFGKVYEKGQVLKKAWWMQQGRENIGNSRFNTPLFMRMLFATCGIRGEPKVVENRKYSAIDLSQLGTDDLESLQKIMEKAKKKEQEQAQQEEYGEIANARIAVFRGGRKQRSIA